MPSEGWREAFAVVGAVLVGVTALGAHVSVCPVPADRAGLVAASAHLPFVAAARATQG